MSNNTGNKGSSDKQAYLLKSYTRSETSNEENLLKLEERCKISALGSISTDSSNLSSLFYIDTKFSNDTNNTVVYCFRPVLKPDKFMAVSDNKVLFKSRHDIRDSCHGFRKEMANNDYCMFESLDRPGFYLTVNEDGQVYLSEKKQRSSWFKLLTPGDDIMKEIESVVNSSNITLVMEEVLEAVLSFEE